MNVVRTFYINDRPYIDARPESGEEETCKGAACGKPLGYPVEVPADDPRRKGHYVDTAGQLCDPCWNKTYDNTP